MNNLELLKNINLLYVEDEYLQRESVAKTLKMLVGHVFIAKDGKEGLSIFNKENIQVIITDYIMPNINGYEMSKEIRKLSLSIPIIITSAYDEKEKLMNAIDVKAIDYIEKPLNEVKIIESLLLAYNKLIDHNLLSIQISENLYYDIAHNKLYVDNELIHLTKKDLSIIKLLAQNKGKLVTKELIKNTVFNDSTSDSVLRNAFCKLRKKIRYDLIETILDVGYIIR